MNMQTAELKAAFQGALTGGAFGYVGGTWAGDTFGNYAGHALVGCASGAMNGGGGEGCARGAVSQVISKWVTLRTETWSPAGQFAAATIAGGTTSAITGGKFATGAQTAAFGYLFNELMHSAKEARAIYDPTRTPGHHWVTFGSTTDLDISVEARAFWGTNTNGMSLPESVHLPQHSAYTTAVRAELLDWSAKNNIDLATMSADDAKRFSLHVQSSSHPDISRIVGRINTYHSMPSTSRSLYRGLSAVGASGLAELFYPSPMRAPQCAINPNIAGC
jgi:hypothetical protein